MVHVVVVDAAALAVCVAKVGVFQELFACLAIHCEAGGRALRVARVHANNADVKN